MCDDNKKYCGNIGIEHSGGFWIIGWLFTIGIAKITGWKMLFSLILWPYYLGSYFSK
jgi:hypothetical protein